MSDKVLSVSMLYCSTFPLILSPVFPSDTVYIEYILRDVHSWDIQHRVKIDFLVHLTWMGKLLNKFGLHFISHMSFYKYDIIMVEGIHDNLVQIHTKQQADSKQIIGNETRLCVWVNQTFMITQPSCTHWFSIPFLALQ